MSDKPAYKTPFSYYGGKSKIVDLYPAPIHDEIIEPFAGSAAYSWRYHERDIHINDLDPRTFSIWSFLVGGDALDVVRAYVPTTVRAGQRVSELLGDGAAFPGLVELCRAEANQGTQGARGVHDQVTKMGAKCWKIRQKMEYVIPRVAHWKVTNLPYTLIGNRKATWFIDPPYSNSAGRRYRTSTIDYTELAEYCGTRWGQVLVCENESAAWGGPWTPINHGQNSIKSRYQKRNAREVLWLR